MLALQSTPTKYFTAAQTSKLIGLRIKDLAKLRKEGNGPEYQGVEPYIIYRDYKIKAWAVAHVCAPTIWFERFDSPPEDVERIYLINDKDFYRLPHRTEIRFVRYSLYNHRTHSLYPNALQLLYPYGAPTGSLILSLQVR